MEESSGGPERARRAVEEAGNHPGRPASSGESAPVPPGRAAGHPAWARRRRRLKTLLRFALGVAVLAVGVVAAGSFWLVWRLRASLPQLEGELQVAGLEAPVIIQRDALGIPTVQAASAEDLAYATGFLHAQDRFFQMDLERRAAAGELAELLGPLGLSLDRRVRVHQLRARAVEMLAALPMTEQRLLALYAQGVAAGLGSLGAPPPEYLLLRVHPVPWRAADSLLVVLSMFLNLQDASGRYESELGLMHDLLPPTLFAFLAPTGTEWDAPLKGGAMTTPAVPTSDEVDIRRMEPWASLWREAPLPAGRGSVAGHQDPGAGPGRLDGTFLAESGFLAGSNNWAVAGSHTAAGGALLANDMHLALRLPNTWYRARLLWRPPGATEEAQVTGVMLPGVPGIVVGSNGHVAWGFTNSYADWSDLVIVEVDPEHPDTYLTPDGPTLFGHRTEILKVNSCVSQIFCEGVRPAEKLQIVSTIWGPIIDHDYRGRPRALRWVAHDSGAINFEIWKMATAKTLEEAMAVAHRAGIPGQNCTLADDHGRIGWTLMGRLPRRIGFSGRLPVSWADGSHRWAGRLPPAEVPRILDPPGGRIWTANARVVDGAELALLGDGGYALGARARQIRDDLEPLEEATEGQMLAIQLDDRALFLSRWRDLLLEILTPDALKDHPRRQEFRRLVKETWTAHASIDSVSFRLVRAFRLKAQAKIFAPLIAPLRKADPRFVYRDRQQEGPLWKLVTTRPPHFLPPAQASWNDWLLHLVDLSIEAFQGEKDAGLDTQTWGKHNTVRVNHPLGLALPFLGRWLNAPPQQLPGAGHMPRFQAVGGGASERMVVSPGREDQALFHMPGGQSGHPLSPHYLDGHAAWAAGRPAPFLPGPVKQTLVLNPQTE